ncbi:MAG: histidine phosphatase family protein [Candidatus Competibacteraceae bacterium]|nr:histidine phosphatase family protein [Candidatus Competibacteraceae bacterium]
MKKLILVRHAKSDWDNPFLSDFDRPLNHRGLHDAPMMAERIIQKGHLPDVVVSSDARRALDTAELMMEAWHNNSLSLHKEHILYHAPAETIFDIFKQHTSDFDSIMLVSHNPGITDFVLLFSNLKIDNVPTCGVMVFSFMDGDNDLRPFRLIDFDFPRNPS